MKTTLGENLFTVSGLLSPEECAAFIERGEALGFEKATVRTRSGRDMRPDIRDNGRAAFTDAALAAALWERVRPLVPAVLEGGAASGLDEDFRFYRYDPGQQFKAHRDGVVKKPGGLRSRLTCLFYLNGGFTGGDTVFYGRLFDGERPIEAVVTPAAGTALFFLHEWLHEGRLLTAGRKYVLRSDVFYRYDDEG